MKNLVHILLIFFISNTIDAQEVTINLSKGASKLFFDLESNSKLSTSVGLSLHQNKHAIGVNYNHYFFKYNQSITSSDQLFLNYQNNINSLNFNYQYYIGNIDQLRFDVGFIVGISFFDISGNLFNNQGLSYQNYSYDQWDDLGYFTENNFETSLSELNLDQINNYPHYFFSFGPSASCSFTIIENLDLNVKTIYRKNSIDLLDNVNSKNSRSIPFETNDDNQIDLFVGLTFNLSPKKQIDSDSLMSIIEEITEDNFSQNTINNNKLKVVQSKEATSEKELITKDEYILNFFKVFSDTIQEDLKIDFNNISDTNLILSSHDKIVMENDNFEEPIDTLKSIEVLNKDLTINTYYLIVGVFSQSSNLKTLANSLDISSENTFIKDGLYYLYLNKSNELNEIRQLRDNLDVECWIYSEK